MADRSIKALIDFGLSPTDALVMAWLEKHGISPDEVMSYRITRGTQEMPTIELMMHYSEEKAE